MKKGFNYKIQLQRNGTTVANHLLRSAQCTVPGCNRRARAVGTYNVHNGGTKPVATRNRPMCAEHAVRYCQTHHLEVPADLARLAQVAGVKS